MTDELIPTREDIAAVIDHTFLKTSQEGVSPAEQKDAIQHLVREASQWQAFAVCIRPEWVSYAVDLIRQQSHKPRIVTVVGFPDGDQASTSQKVVETQKALMDGTDEIDMVMRVKDFKAGSIEKVRDDIRAISKICGDHVLKVIIETAYLSATEKSMACRLVLDSLLAAHSAQSPALLQRRFVKTSTGFAKPGTGVAVGATLADIKIMMAEVGGKLGIKPAGGISNLMEAVSFWLAAGSPRTDSGIDPYRFRIGSSSLLRNLFTASQVKGY